jgi:hypothetical protein
VLRRPVNQSRTARLCKVMCHATSVRVEVPTMSSVRRTVVTPPFVGPRVALNERPDVATDVRLAAV